MLCVKDGARHFVYVGLTKITDGDAVAYHIIHAVGNVTVGIVYTGGCSGLIRACNRLGLNYDISTPEVPETSAVAERRVQDVQDGMRVLLVHAGLLAVCLVVRCKLLCHDEQCH